jgi:hypothetical protein
LRWPSYIGPLGEEESTSATRHIYVNKKEEEEEEETGMNWNGIGITGRLTSTEIDRTVVCLCSARHDGGAKRREEDGSTGNYSFPLHFPHLIYSSFSEDRIC